MSMKMVGPENRLRSSDSSRERRRRPSNPGPFGGKTLSVLVALGVVSVFAVGGCGASSQAQPQPLFAGSEEQPTEAEAPPAAPQCVDEDDEPVTCLSDDECCSGFVCGKDPELNQRLSYCIYAG